MKNGILLLWWDDPVKLWMGYRLMFKPFWIIWNLLMYILSLVFRTKGSLVLICSTGMNMKSATECPGVSLKCLPTGAFVSWWHGNVIVPLCSLHLCCAVYIVSPKYCNFSGQDFDCFSALWPDKYKMFLDLHVNACLIGNSSPCY